MNEEEQALEDNPDLRRAVFGREVEMFLESDVGAYLIQCATSEIDEATEKLKRVDPYKPSEIQDLQNKVWRAESVIGWLGDAVKAGLQAKQALQESP